jgi:hypothetical protein
MIAFFFLISVETVKDRWIQAIAFHSDDTKW